MFQCSSASRKFLNRRASSHRSCSTSVSVLFSEPKISQSSGGRAVSASRTSFSALQRAENFSIQRADGGDLAALRFSALQRAENFSMSMLKCGKTMLVIVSVLFSEPKISQLRPLAVSYYVHYSFQCSSASRKFLNFRMSPKRCLSKRSFSALQRAENFSIRKRLRWYLTKTTVSVLFSEPKISQFLEQACCYRVTCRFSALQRAENFSIALAMT